ncbi:MAG: PepSY-associated TM helix domain-containing protein [Rhodospirillaceae bacterium]
MTSAARVLIRRIHLWLGLGLGLILVVLGITGSALVFYIEIDDLLHREVQGESSASAPSWDSPVWDRALATARARWPDPRGTWSFEVTGEGGAIPARYYPPSLHSHHHAEREMVWFSSDGAHVVRDDTWGQYLMSWLYELHANLITGEAGRQVAGWSGFAALLLLTTGVIAWWPRGSWRKALAFKRNAVPLRRLRDLHKLPGIWTMPLLFILVLTGAFLALPDIKVKLFNTVFVAPENTPPPLSAASTGRQISVSEALASAHRALRDARLAFIDVPAEGREPFRMRVQVPGDPHQRFPSSNIFVDQYSGDVLAIQDVRSGPSATTVASWIRTLHDGTIGGLTVRILVVVLGFVPAFLFVTGFLRWRRRLGASHD